jgi:hypothetical protein
MRMSCGYNVWAAESAGEPSMPIHDWTKVEPGIYRDYRNA